MKEFVDSHDELVKVCQCMMAIILNHQLMNELENILISEEVEPGFADRAETARKKLMRERIIRIRDAN